MASSNHLQAKIDQMERQESTTSLQHDEPSYSEIILGTVYSPSGNTKHKVLGVLWYPEFDQIRFDFSGVFDLALYLTPTKRNIASIMGSSTIHGDFCHRLLFDLEYYFNGYAQTRAAGMISFLMDWSRNGSN